MSKKPKTASRDGFGILNPYGDMWTTEIYETEEAARASLIAFWRGVKHAKTEQFRIVKARQRTSFVSALQERQP